MKTAAATIPSGATLHYNIFVENFGNVNAATGVMVTDTLPAGETLIIAVGGNGCTGMTTVTCDMGTIGAFSSSTVGMDVSVTAPSGTMLQNCATVSSDNDPNPANNTNCATTTVTAPTTDVSISKTGPATADIGGAIVYSINLHNNGPSDAQNVTLSDTAPAGETFTGAGGTGCTFTATTVTCSPGTLHVNETFPFSISATVSTTAADGSTLSNTATVSTSTTDSNSANNSSTANTTVVARADLSATKTGPASATVGAPVSYTLAVNNAGPTLAASVALTDSLPAGTTFASLSQTTGPTFSCTTPVIGGTGMVNCTLASFAASGSATFTLVLSTTAPVSLSNTATVTSGTTDPTPGNNSGTALTTVARAQPALTTTNAGVVQLGSGGKLTDSATLSGGFNPTGTITFTLHDPSNALVDTETVPVNGNGTFTTPTGFTPAVAGTYQWIAAYSGDSNNLPVSSPQGAEAETVSPATSTTMVSRSPNPSVAGDSVTFTATVSCIVPPTGSVTFVDTTTNAPLGSGTVLGGTASVMTSSLQGGTHTISASYNGDANCASSANTTTQTVNPRSTTTTLMATPNPSTVGQPVTFTATVSCGGFTPTGTVTFTVDGSTVATVAVNNAGVASFATSSLAVGTHAITAAYSGDADCATSTSPQLSQLVGAPPLFVLPVFPPTANPPTGTVPFTPPPFSIAVFGPDGLPGSVALSLGCSSVVISAPAGTPISAIAALVQPPGSVVSIWRYDNSLHGWQAGYFAGGGPVDFSSTGGGTEAYAICVGGPAVISSR